MKIDLKWLSEKDEKANDAELFIYGTSFALSSPDGLKHVPVSEVFKVDPENEKLFVRQFEQSNEVYGRSPVLSILEKGQT